jgi:beta-glucosidase
MSRNALRVWMAGMTMSLGLCMAARADEGKANPATTPQPRTDAWWTERHELLCQRAREGGEIIFIGDSITQGWESAGKGVWEQFYAPRRAVNLGISGDQTQHVLWRLQNGNLERIRPRVAVIMIGTNNAPHAEQSAGQIAEGVKAIVNLLREKLPDTRILLLAIFPRGEKPNPQRDKLAEINQHLVKLADGQAIHYLDIGDKLLQPDGTISNEIMPDFLHLSPKGYAIWAEAIETKLAQLYAEAAPDDVPPRQPPANTNGE